MTAIEFYDRTPIENIISSLTTAPDKIIFIGEGKTIKKSDKVISDFLKKKNQEIEIDYRFIKRNNLNNIVEVLSCIVEEEEQCVFDLTGGEDLVLVAMGIVFQKYADKNIQMQRFNFNNGVVSDCDNDGRIVFSSEPVISIEDNIKLHNGVIKYKEKNLETGTYVWDLNDEFVNDIKSMWNICKSDPGKWNSQLNVLNAIDDFSDDETSLHVTFDISTLKDKLAYLGTKYIPIVSLLKSLNSKGIINSFSEKKEVISFSFKNYQIKKSLSKSGNLLELRTLVAAKTLLNKDGSQYYTDAMNGVYIDWDGELHDITDKEKDTENEIDIILMRGIVPIFISCKNGRVDDDELYKLEAVTDRFGGIYSKKILLATYLGKTAQSMEYFRQRANDMDISLSDKVHLLNDEQFDKMIKNLIYK